MTSIYCYVEHAIIGNTLDGRACNKLPFFKKQVYLSLEINKQITSDSNKQTYKTCELPFNANKGVINIYGNVYLNSSE